MSKSDHHQRGSPKDFQLPLEFITKYKLVDPNPTFWGRMLLGFGSRTLVLAACLIGAYFLIASILSNLSGNFRRNISSRPGDSTQTSSPAIIVR